MEPPSLEPITFEEYEAAYRRFIRCLNETGVGVTDEGFDPTSHTFQYTTEAGDPELERATGRIPADDCYDREFIDADERWQIQQTAPFAKERFDRALAFFASRGLADLLDGSDERVNTGWLLQHAASVLGEEVVRDFTLSEFTFESEDSAPLLSSTRGPEWLRIGRSEPLQDSWMESTFVLTLSARSLTGEQPVDVLRMQNCRLQRQVIVRLVEWLNDLERDALALSTFELVEGVRLSTFEADEAAIVQPAQFPVQVHWTEPDGHTAEALLVMDRTTLDSAREGLEKFVALD